ncbi:hypothetical protein Lalb_Chr11g0071581 [Lupinus albus]|uniref:Uncharacterized protein n=1 Tax=Lupinus albus TaxID=3870 RepID=A0A6A4PRX3_LUPAL|nr:hypothetical protein Lalb_Chr11g0071581 [Lupinus albus]
MCSIFFSLFISFSPYLPLIQIPEAEKEEEVKFWGKDKSLVVNKQYTLARVLALKKSHKYQHNPYQIRFNSHWWHCLIIIDTSCMLPMLQQLLFLSLYLSFSFTILILSISLLISLKQIFFIFHHIHFILFLNK